MCHFDRVHERDRRTDIALAKMVRKKCKKSPVFIARQHSNAYADSDVAILSACLSVTFQYWSRAQHQHHVTTSLMKLAVGERNVATKLGINSRLCQRILFLYNTEGACCSSFHVDTLLLFYLRLYIESVDNYARTPFGHVTIHSYNC